jgi:hypothetical protein
MGLALEVGYLADMLENDAEGAEWAAADFAAINQTLLARGFSAHEEPADCLVWSAAFYGYGGLNALREFAGLVWLGQGTGREYLLDGTQTPSADALVAAFLEHVSGMGDLTLVGRALRAFFRAKEKPKLPLFVHLLVHSDCDGYYVPVDFELPAIPKGNVVADEHLWPLGSVLRLEREIADLAGHLQLPAQMTSDDADLQHCLETPNRSLSAAIWQAQPIAAHSCLILREACQRSLASGAAIRFC